jgi:hypothetical protein
VHELDEGLRHQLFTREPEGALPCRVQPLEVPAEVEKRQHVDREIEKSIVQFVREFPVVSRFLGHLVPWARNRAAVQKPLSDCRTVRVANVAANA